MYSKFVGAVMQRMIAYKFRICPDSRRRSEIDGQLTLAQQFYNKLLEKAILSYKNGDKKISMAKLNRFVREIIAEDQKYLKLYSQTRCEIEYRLLKAFQNFFRRVKENNAKGKRQKAGFPRFKSRDRYKTIIYHQDNGSFRITKDRLRVSRIGSMKIETRRQIEGMIKTMTIKREAGAYYAIFTASNEVELPAAKDTRPVGVDLGLKNFIALSDGTTIQKPQFMRQNHKRVSHWQRVVAKRKRGSKRRERAKEKLAKAYADSDRQNGDFIHKLTTDLVENRGYTSFALEDLSIKNMMLNHRLARSIHNASWGKFQHVLSYKAESAGMIVMKLSREDTMYSTQECSNCGNIKHGEGRLTLEERLYQCNKCGLAMDRDVNAAKVILKRATLGQRGSHAQGEGVRPSAGKAVLEEPRTYPAQSVGAGGSLGLWSEEDVTIAIMR